MLLSLFSFSLAISLKEASNGDKTLKSIKIENPETSSLTLEEAEEYSNLETIEINNSYKFVIPEGLEKFPKFSNLIFQNIFMIENWERLEKVENLQSLKISGCFLSTIPHEIFNLTNLEKLEVDKNNIFEISEDIKKLKNLWFLDLSNNSFFRFPREIFEIENLSAIFLDNNKIKPTPKNEGEPKEITFQNQIYHCQLSNNNCKEIPIEIYEMKSLEILNLSGNKIQKLDTDFFNLKELIFLDISNNLLEELNKEIANLDQIETLKVDLNQLEDIPDLPKSLKYFKFSKNKFKKLPVCLFDCNNLEFIEAKFNQIEEIDPKIALLTNLNVLNFDFNNISKIPDEIIKLEKIEKLFLANNQISVIPKFISNFQFLQVLHLCNNPIKEIYESIFYISSLEEISLENSSINQFLPDFIPERKSNLDSIFLQKNNLLFIPDFVFSCIKLKKLNLSSNLIANIDEEKFKNIKELDSLNLNENKLTKLCSFKNNTKITKLLLSSNQFENFPEEVCELSELEHLEIEKNKIKIIPKSIEKLKKLNELFLNSNEIEKLGDDGIFNIINLRQLTLNSNKISKISSKIGNLTNLNHFEAENNELTEFPIEIFNLKNLKTVSLNFNKIENICKDSNKTDEYGKESKINHLFFGNNNLDRIPDCFYNLKNLKILELENNKLTEILPKINNLVLLEKLILKKNRLKELPDLKTNKNLKDLNLSQNLIEVFPMGILENKFLLELNLKSNQIKTIPDEITKIQSLKKVDLSYNNISILPDALFNLKNLKIIFISNNFIEEIPDSISNNLNLKKLSIHVNSIKKVSKNVQFLMEKKFFRINLMANLIPITKAENGRFSINELKFFGKKSLFPQYTELITLEEAFENHKKQALHWNISKLKKDKMDFIVEKSSKISNKMIYEIWDKILKFLIDPENISFTNEKKVKLEEIVVEERIIDDNIIQKLIKKIKNRKLMFMTTNGAELREKADKYFKQLSESILDSDQNDFLLSFVKFSFYKALLELNNGGSEEIEFIKYNLTAFCKNSMEKCFMGQKEGILQFYNIFSLNDYSQLFENLIEEQIANLKDKAFLNAIRIDHPQNVHFINMFRNHFKDILGISNDSEDKYEFQEFKDCLAREGNVLAEFFKQFTVEKVQDEILNAINKDQNYKDRAVMYLKKLHPDFSVAKISKDFFELYKSEEDKNEEDPIFREKLKREAFLNILLDLKLVVKKDSDIDTTEQKDE